MNVLFLINHAGKAGTERYVAALINNAAEYGARPYFAYNEAGPLLDKLQGAGVTCRRLPMSGPYDLKAARLLAAMCDEFKIDVVHTNYLRENYIAILTKIFFNKKLRVIYTNHFVTGNSLPVRLANLLMTRMDHKIISVCAAGAARLIKNGNAKGKIIVIHNAVDPLEWRPGGDYCERRASTRARYGIEGDGVVFLCASRFAHDKGHKFLLDALALLAGQLEKPEQIARGHMASSDQNVSPGQMKNTDETGLVGSRRLHVLLAGDGPLLPEIRALSEARGLTGFVRFLGFVDDVKSLFYASDIYVNPSEHEALSFLILEALASGLPVIAADMGGNNEIINGRNGCGTLVKYGDAEGLSRVMQSYMEGGGALTEMKANALRTIERKFALKDMLARTYASFI